MQLNELLGEIFPEPPAGFEARVRRYAAAAAALARLKPEHDLVGFQPVSLSNYVEGLARRAGITLEALLEWAGIRDWGEVAAPGIGRLCRELGMSLRESLTNCRMSIAEAAGFAPLSLQMTLPRGGPGHGGLLAACEESLAAIEVSYDDDLRRVRTSMEEELRRAFQI
jgi:hypothetical protein